MWVVSLAVAVPAFGSKTLSLSCVCVCVRPVHAAREPIHRYSGGLLGYPRSGVRLKTNEPKQPKQPKQRLSVALHLAAAWEIAVELGLQVSESGALSPDDGEGGADA